MWVDHSEFKRLGTFEAAPLPGGDAAASLFFCQLVGRAAMLDMPIPSKLRKLYRVSSQDFEGWKSQVHRKINSPETHAVGRLFDTVAAALGAAPFDTTYEGQAAIMLEALALRYGRIVRDRSMRFDSHEQDGCCTGME